MRGILYRNCYIRFHGSRREEIAATGQVSGVSALAANQGAAAAAAGSAIDTVTLLIASHCKHYGESRRRIER